MKVLVADDHAIVRKGLVQILREYSQVTEVVEARDGEEALKKIENDIFDLYILDISMPGKTGLDVLSELKVKNPDSKVLILSIYPEKEYAVRSFKLGASGYISKDNAADELVKAIDYIRHGRKYISRDVSETLLDLQMDQSSLAPHEILSEREYRVFILLVTGKKISEIADELYLSPKTVSTYKKRIFEKMQMGSVSDLTRYAITHKLID
ncbi:response regulator [Bacteroidota bacterium]